MVRLSLVNLYLHGFNNPNIHEYDTLSSEDRWNENFDVVLANPPFMSPKGGIRPHKKFTISSNRSEVLFVDYIAEHLNPNGKAGIIVPEGIIFQSGTAYKDLRKMLVENHLYAVVSLPAGVFNPYSGVKTSILLMDKEIAKNREEILFIKIDNDGYNLGAQRTAVKGGQLEEAIQIAHKFVETGDFEETPIAHLVPKAEIAKNGDYNLSGERYKNQQIISNLEFPTVEVGEIMEFQYGKPLKKEDRKDGLYPVFGSNGVVGFHNEFIANAPFIVVGRKGSAGALHFSEISGYPIDTTFFIENKNPEKLNIRYAFHILSTLNLDKVNVQAGIPGLNRNDAYALKIPLPPISIQEEIVAEIEGYQKIIDGAKAVVANYKPKIDIDPDWEMVELGKFVIFNQTGLVKNKTEQGDENEFFYLKMDGITYDGQLDLSKLVKVNATLEEFEKYTLVENDFLYNTRNTPDLVGKSTVFDSESGKYLFNNNIMRIRFNTNLNPYFANFILNSDEYKKQIRSFVDGTTSVAALYPKNYFGIKIPVPEIEAQNAIVTQIKKEQELVNANKQLIEIFEQKIKDRISKVWGE